MAGRLKIGAPDGFAYMCGIAWEYEIGHTDVTIYPTLRALRASMKSKGHEKSCGWVKVKLVPVARKRGTDA